MGLSTNRLYFQSTFKGDNHFHLIADIAIWLSQHCKIVDTRLVDFSKYQITQYCLIQEFLRNFLGEIRLAEISGEKLVCTMVNVQIDNVVVIHVLNLHTNLDAKLRESMRDELRALQQRLGITSLYVTHDQSEAMAISDKVVIMKDGVICQQGTPQEIYEQPASRFVANFIGKANFIDGIFKGRDGEAALVEIGGKTFSIPAPGKMEGVEVGGACCLTVRPESFLLTKDAGALPGTVSRATYYGAKIEYEVMLNEQPIIVEVYNPQLTERFSVGDTVSLSLIEGCVRVLK